MNQRKRSLALASVFVALALAIVLGAATVTALEPDANIKVCPPPGTGCDYTTIQEALDNADPGDTIQVAQGIYTENLTINAMVTLEGGYSGPPDWSRDVEMYETVIRNGQATTPADWDGRQVSKPAVISDGAELKMWYDGRDYYDDVRVGMAFSGDGTNWTKAMANPVLLPGDPGEWDDASVEFGTYVIKEDDVYKMWYEGGSDDGVRHTGYATSIDGLVWEKYSGNPVIQAGPESYDQQVAGHGCVLNDGGTYKRWYHAANDLGTVIAYATAPDETTWTKQGPVLLPEEGGWDQFLWGPSVLKLGDTYWMWYAGASPSGPPSIGVVTSTNGIDWNRNMEGPVLARGWPIGDPMVITDGGKLHMWYSNYQQGTIDYAESEDGINWTLYPNPVLTPGELANWGGRPLNIDEGSSGAVVDGFTLTNGDTFAGGGLLIANGGTALVTNCRIQYNRGPGWGGGVWVTNADATISNSVIAYNSSDGSAGIEVNHDWGPSHLNLESSTVEFNMGGQFGGMQVWGNLASATVQDTTFYGNRGDQGGGVGISNAASATIVDTRIYNNTAYNEAGGIAIRENSSATITGTQVYSNTAEGGEAGGIMVNQESDLSIADSWMVANIAQGNDGGGIVAGGGSSFYGENLVVAGNYSEGAGGGFWLRDGGTFRIVNSTIVGNHSPQAGGAIATKDVEQVEITNTLVISNTGPTGITDRDGSGSTILLNYCDTYGNSPDGTDGVTIIRTNCLGTPPQDGLDPLFVGGTWPGGQGPEYADQWLAYDLHLQVDSPAIDAGTPDGAPGADIEGTARDATPDMGAYEWVEGKFYIYLPIVVMGG